LRRFSSNRGFARAANEGCRLSRGDWLLLLNPDVSADGEPFGAGQLPRPLRPWPPGRRFLLRGGTATPLQVAR